MGEEALLSGQRVLPQQLLGSGFVFRQPELGGALRAELGLYAGPA
jgi:NAD dependent epimerase/dehydratase family enzyme